MSSREHESPAEAPAARDPGYDHATAGVGGSDEQFTAVLDHIRRARGVDFSSYKPSTLRRRFDKRLAALGLRSYLDYHDHLLVDPDEFARLFDTILINVTDFFRDADAWEHLREALLPRLLAEKGANEPIRAWCVGCSSGQEPYTLAMVLAETLGDEAFERRVKIYGTDVDEDALDHARHAVYSEKELVSVPQDARERYFEAPPRDGDGNGQEPTGEPGLQVRGDLRRQVIFGRHDVFQDAPISRLDLLLCRNTLMYFNADVQSRILDRFHFAVRPGGLLFLGKAEKLLSHTGLFSPVDDRRRFFTKITAAEPRHRFVSQGAEGDGGGLVTHLSTDVTLRDAAFDAGAVARLAIDPEGRLSLATASARTTFGIGVRDLGRPLRELEISYRPAELRGAIDRARETRQPVELRSVEWHPRSGDRRFFDVEIQPLVHDGQPVGTLVSFTDVTGHELLRERLRETERALEQAHVDLQGSNEELETMNEELQSTVEELETTNEELQSTNEELETMNEELQSTNDELHAANEQLAQRGEEITEVNEFLAAVLGSLGRAVVVVDPQMLVRVWNEEAEDLWGLRRDEVSGQHVMNLDIGLDVSDLREPIRLCLSAPRQTEEIVLGGRNRRGMDITCHVMVSTLTNRDDVLGCILLIEERRH